jgi:hypothetical protein
VVLQDLAGHKVLKEEEVPQDHKVQRDLRVLQVLQGVLVQLDHKVLRDQQEHLDLQVPQDHKVLQVVKVHKAH